MDHQENSIVVKGLSKSFVLPHEKFSGLKQAFINIFNHNAGSEIQHALHDVSFEIKKGEFFGIVGRNGSGKSTLLKILAGIYTPDKGKVQVNGTIASFIELGVGFNPELTGRENLYLNGALLGFSRRQMEEMYEDIVTFAELERFMDQKLKNYSSGMQVRLAFSIAIRAKSDILIVDEVLAVGDANFQKKCFDVFKNIRKEGKTVVFVTHDMGAVQDFCDRAMLINNGKIMNIGKPGVIAHDYNEMNIQEARKTSVPALSSEDTSKPMETVAITTAHKGKLTRLFRPQQTIDIIVEYEAHQDVENPIMGITIKDLTGRPLVATNTKAKGISTGLIKKSQKRRVVFSLENIFNDGSYSISPAVASEDAKIFYDWVEEAAYFDVSGWKFPAGVVQPEHTVKVEIIR